MDTDGQFQSSNDVIRRNNDRENTLLEKQKSYHRALLDSFVSSLTQEEVNKFPEDKKEVLHLHLQQKLGPSLNSTGNDNVHLEAV